MKLDIKKVNKYLNSNKYDFKIFNMHYNVSEQKTIDNFVLEKDSLFQYFGSLDTMAGMNAFLSDIGNNNDAVVNKMEKLIINMIKTVLKSFDMEYYWIDIRVGMPRDEYDIPRWHKDGKFFNSNTISQKFVTVLKGPGTLLIKGTPENDKIYNEYLMKEWNEIKPNSTTEDILRISKKYRFILKKKFANEKIIQLKNSQSVVFYTGIPSNKAALHSEPKFDEPRLFISILPGSENDVMTLKQKWGR